MNVSAALWAPNPGKHTGNEPATVPSCLTGFLIRPIPRTPDRTAAVPILELLFEKDHATGFDVTAPPGPTGFTVASSIDPKTKDLTITLTGDHDATLPNSGFVLCALRDSWVTAQRAAVLDDLTSHGFATLTSSQVNVTAMSETTTLNDWPDVALLGST
jgi:hypothetical protein